MKLEVIDENYSAIVVKIDKLIPLDWCDNVVAFPIFGYQAIVDKNTQIWDVWIVFTAETQLSEAFCKNNNLYRDETMNIDTTRKWYVDNNRRVRAMKFRWHKSALFMPLFSLIYLDKSIEDKLSIWDKFNTIDWVEVCKKYVVYRWWLKQNKIRCKDKVFERVDNKTFPEHFDTENYFRNIQNYRDDNYVSVTQKLHWTSGRFGNILVRRKLSFIERILKRLWVKINEYEYDYIAGSRRVVKDIKTKQEITGYYVTDVRNTILDRYKNIIPKNYVIYGEVIGYDWEKQIQKDYTYNLNKWELEMYVYRISIVNPDGVVCDMTYNQICEFCKPLWYLKVVPLLREWNYVDFKDIVETFIDKRFYEIYPQAVWLSEKSPCDEWVCIRREWLQPYVTKAKSPIFLEKETKDLDEWIVDLESNESIDA